MWQGCLWNDTLGGVLVWKNGQSFTFTVAFSPVHENSGVAFGARPLSGWNKGTEGLITCISELEALRPPEHIGHSWEC